MKKFKTESQKVLDLMINSIYTHKEIFIRELLSNASDAIDKLYYKSLTDGISGLAREDFAIEIKADKDARTLSIIDNGIGMTEEELDKNLGIIARSGSREFKENNEPKDEIGIIGQFGVGFYSAFMVSDKVKVVSKAYGEEKAYEWVSNGSDGKEYRCGILSLEEEEIVCELRFIKEDGLELSSRIYLFQGLPKADKMELIIQKAVELGAYEIIPVAAKRCVVKLNEKKEASKLTRWQEIAKAAAKQSKRGIIPRVQKVMSFSEAVAYSRDIQVKMIPYELAEGMEKTKEIIEGISPGQDIAVFIGPEGGFDPEEIALAMKNEVLPVTLGRHILRTETAGMAVLSILMYHLEQ